MREEKRDKWSYPPFAEWIWKSYDNTKVINIDDFISTHLGSQFIIGTDSQTEGSKCSMTTALIAYKWGRGGSVICHTQKVARFLALRQKLLAEAMRSLETAWYVDPKIPDEDVIVIHVDVNTNVKWESGKYRDELVGFILSQGFEPACKPDSWGSSKVADRRCRK